MFIDRNGEMKNDASPELSQINRSIQQKENSLSNLAQMVMKKAKTDGFVESDAELTIREGKLLIPVTSTLKRKIPGLVQGYSASGKTSFIEPLESVEIHNDLQELYNQRQEEIIRLLKELASFVRPYIPDLQILYRFLGIIDFIRAKTLLAGEINACLPQLFPKKEFEWFRAVHPVLFLNHKAAGKKLVPLNIEISSINRIVLVSGPNAGGKSVVLKTVGLLQYMLQCGLLVPMDDNSVAGWFSQLYIDIGDEQSIENDLSTYSSHLQNMKFFLKNMNQNSLLLIDEFGSGTEPVFGGAISEALLEKFVQSGARGIITTHYTNLKQFAAKKQGIINAAMLYNQQEMEPEYKLNLGMPGSSFAFEIARKTGFPEEILKKAGELAGTGQVKLERLLHAITRDKNYWEKKRLQIKKDEREIQKYIDEIKTKSKQANKEKRQIISEAKKEASEILKEINRKVEATIREIRENQANKEKTKKLRGELEEFKKLAEDKLKSFDDERGNKNSLEQTIEKIPKKYLVKEKKINPKEIEREEKKELKPGDKVKMAEQDVYGELIEIGEKSAVVSFGNFITTVHPDKINKISQADYRQATRKKTNPAGKIGINLAEKRLEFNTKIDVRGMRVDEALPIISRYIDDAITLNIGNVSILHGTGNGILRQVIRDFLKSTDWVAWFGDERIEFGGAGITNVKFHENL